LAKCQGVAVAGEDSFEERCSGDLGAVIAELYPDGAWRQKEEPDG
jgi:hypothetical protein